MKLDPMIIEGKKPLDCFDVDIARQFIGKKGYFGTCSSQFMDLDTFPKCIVDELKEIDNYDNYPFISAGGCCYCYFLPVEWVKPEKQEIKWRPFTLDEFIDRFDLEVGTRVFLIRSKTIPVNQRRLLLTGIIQDKEPCSCGVCLGGFYFTFSDLFQMFDVCFGKNDWQPFGMEE